MIPTYEAIELFERARRQGWWHRARARLLGRPVRLLALSTIVADSPINGRRYCGTRSVPIRYIRGSEGRRAMFDDAFHPLHTHTRGRWQAIATAWLAGTSLPPVELIQLGDVYVVRDGHHRISVLRALGVAQIDANVTVLDIASSRRWEGSLSERGLDTAVDA